MYTILVQDDHSLIATQRERIMQRSKCADTLHFLVPPNYDGMDMGATTVCLEYLTPVGREYKSEVLTLSEELYKDHLEYKLPFDTNFTREAGDLQMQLTFTNVSMDADGNISQYVRKTSTAIINIVPISAWADIVPDSALTALDQRMIYVNSMIQQMEDINMALADSVPDDLMVKDGKVYLSQNGHVMANTIGADVLVPRTKDDDGIDDGLIELDEINHNEGDPNCDCGCDHDNFEDLDSYIAAQPDAGNGNFSEL